MKAVGFAGLPRSGKTTLAKALASCEPHAEIRSFGGIVRAEARVLQQDPECRGVLQAIGMKMLEDTPRFVSRLLSTVPEDARIIIIDGIRHPAVLQELQDRLQPHPLLLMYVDTPENIRQARLRQHNELPDVSDHPVEAEIPYLQQLANLHVRGDDHIDYAVSGIRAVMATNFGDSNRLGPAITTPSIRSIS